MKSKRYNNVVAKGCKIYPVVNIALVSSVIDVFFYVVLLWSFRLERLFLYISGNYFYFYGTSIT